MVRESSRIGTPTLIVEFDQEHDCPIDFLGESSDLVYFISFAYSERYGSDHDLARLASHLKRDLGINLRPLLTFGDAQCENSEEEQALEALWQEAPPLAKCCRDVAAAVDSTPNLKRLSSDFPDLSDRLGELGEMAAWASNHSARIRLTYIL